MQRELHEESKKAENISINHILCIANHEEKEEEKTSVTHAENVFSLFN